MKNLKVEELSEKSFSLFGTFFDPLNCGQDMDKGTSPLLFYPDRLVLLYENSNYVSVSPLIVKPRPLTINVTENHSYAEEAMGGFDQDVVFHVGPAGDKEPDPDQFRVFRLPAGWWVRIKRGVWHLGPYTVNDQQTIGTVILPPSTYTNDCRVIELNEEIKISF